MTTGFRQFVERHFLPTYFVPGYFVKRQFFTCYENKCPVTNSRLTSCRKQFVAPSHKWTTNY